MELDPEQGLSRVAEGVTSHCRSVPRALWTRTPSNSSTRSSSLREVSSGQVGGALEKPRPHPFYGKGTLLPPPTFLCHRLPPRGLALPLSPLKGLPPQVKLGPPSRWGGQGAGGPAGIRRPHPARPLLSPDATTYAHFLFNAFDADGNGAIRFEVGPCRPLPHTEKVRELDLAVQVPCLSLLLPPRSWLPALPSCSYTGGGREAV